MKCQKVDICKPLCVVVTATCFSAYLCADFRGPELHHQGRKLNMYLGNFWFQVVVSSIFYFLPLRLPLQLALAFENGWQKKHTTYPPYKHSIEKKGGVDFFSPKNPWKQRMLNDPYESSIHRRRWLIPPEAFGARSTVSGGGDFEGRPSSQWQCRSGTFRCRESRGGFRCCCCWNTGVLVEGERWWRGGVVFLVWGEVTDDR